MTQEHWPWWVSGLALSAVMLIHWFALHRMMAVSGRISALVDRARHGRVDTAPVMSQEALLAAIQEATEDEFGAASAADDDLPESSPHGADDVGHDRSELAPPQPAAITSPVATASRTPAQHVLFFLGLIGGGAIAALSSSRLDPTATLHGDLFAQLTNGQTFISAAILFAGGVLVGFGTRMAGGCTSGHGLCGTSRLQPGSLLATASFFSVGILVSFGLGALL